MDGRRLEALKIPTRIYTDIETGAKAFGSPRFRAADCGRLAAGRCAAHLRAASRDRRPIVEPESSRGRFTGRSRAGSPAVRLRSRHTEPACPSRANRREQGLSHPRRIPLTSRRVRLTSPPMFPTQSQPILTSAGTWWSTFRLAASNFRPPRLRARESSIRTMASL